MMPSRAPRGRLLSRSAGSCHRAIRFLVLLGMVALGAGAVTSTARAAELVMLEQKGCHWCIKWHEEIGPIYPKTSESQIAPLRRVDIHDPWPADLASVNKDRFTPTFVLVHEGREIGRIRGYAGEDFFWGLLEQMMRKLPKASEPRAAPWDDQRQAMAVPTDGLPR